MHKGLIRLFSYLVLALACLPLMAAESAAPEGQAIYYQIPEPFTINFLNQSQQQARYLQVKVALMSRNPAVISGAEMNLPMIQDALRNLFTAQQFDSINTVSGREQLQTSARQQLQQILKAETGSDELEQVYFTSFVLQ